LLALGKIGLVVVIGFPLLMYLAQDSLIFHPQRISEAQREAIARRASVQSLFIDGADGTRLHAWYVKGDPGSSLVMYFGGNAEEVSWMIDEAAARAPQVSWLLVDYRGYGASDGSPGEAAPWFARGDGAGGAPLLRPHPVRSDKPGADGRSGGPTGPRRTGGLR
jgi:hypothetical protein